MAPLDEAKSIPELRSLLETASRQHDQDTLRRAVGAIALLLGNTVRQQDAQLFRDAVREIGISVDTVNARWIFRIVKQDLTPELQEWMDGAIAGIMAGKESEDQDG